MEPESLGSTRRQCFEVQVEFFDEYANRCDLFDAAEHSEISSILPPLGFLHFVQIGLHQFWAYEDGKLAVEVFARGEEEVTIDETKFGIS